ncbi:MAG: hypothetical protein ABSC95_20525 [Acetobacteraceae bacterium]|jgi:hypothetical protein
MEKHAHAASAPRPNRSAWWGLGAALAGVAGLLGGVPAAAASLSPQELQVLGGAIAFMQPPPGGGAVAVVYAAGDPTSRQDAEAIAGEIGNGLKISGAPLPAKIVEATALAEGGFVVAIAASGANGPSLGAAVRAAHILCVTADLQAVQAGFCSMAISTDLRVQIVLNHAAAAASGIGFAAAFRMMIHEI